MQGNTDMKDLKKITILHSNDPHGAFFAKEKDGLKYGGISLLSGKLEEFRRADKDLLYVIAGDLFKGSLIDSQFKGLSTIEMINLLRPDVVTIGNHEADYGLAHLLFLEKCARFPIINANMYVSGSRKRLFEPYQIIEKNGMKILFIGIVTNEILMGIKSEELISRYLHIDDYLMQVKTILDAYRTKDIDLTVLVTHIGYEEDKALAQKLGENSGVDLIIGAHSHTLLKKPKIVNGIRIVQAGYDFEHLGRFDLVIDADAHELKECTWQIIDIDSSSCREDALMNEVLKVYRNEVNEKGSDILTTFKRRLLHPSRSEESELADLFADLMKEDSSFDIMMLGTGSFRCKGLGPVVDMESFKAAYPFDNKIFMMEVNGKTFRKMCHHFLKEKVMSEGSSEFFAFSKGVRVIYDPKDDLLVECSYNEMPVKDDDVFKIALQEFHLNNCDEFLGVSYDELAAYGKPMMVVNSDSSTFEEMLRNSFEADQKTEGRTVIKG